MIKTSDRYTDREMKKCTACYKSLLRKKAGKEYKFLCQYCEDTIMVRDDEWAVDCAVDNSLI